MHPAEPNPNRPNVAAPPSALRRPLLSSCLLSIACAAFVACSDGDDERADMNGRCSDFDPLRQPFFGDTHAHTALSFDANARGTRLGPEGAYRYAKGEPIGIPPYDSSGTATQTIQRARALDFVLVSDHAEFLGSVAQCEDEASDAYDHPQCATLRARSPAALGTFSLLTASPGTATYPGLCGDDVAGCIESGRDVWKSSVAAANAANDDSTECRFTALVGYEWTGNPGSRNLHRNVLFRSDDVPDQAIGYFDEPFIEGLWERLREDCLEGRRGCDVLTIPHNPNLAEGTFFEQLDRERQPIGDAYGRERAFMEPLIEVYQHKGASECLPGQLANDELCGFEVLPYSNLLDVNAGVVTEPSPRDFLRDALAEGMKLGRSIGVNPFKHGFVASTDTHIAAPGATTERGYPGHNAADTARPPGLVDDPFQGPGGLAVVWAEENSRSAIFDAMRRRETFGTSGPQIIVRFFGGWTYPDDMCGSPELARIGYEGGVPMGGDLPAPQGSDERPTFVVHAIQDPGTELHPGTPLQLVQIVKGSIDDAGVPQVRVFDVAGDPDNGAAVDLATCEPIAGEGAFADLCTTWTDPEFNPSHPSYYYARVLENPVCRWTQYACNAGGVDCEDATTITTGFEPCCDPAVPPTIQERAWTSPIWYTP